MDYLVRLSMISVMGDVYRFEYQILLRLLRDARHRAGLTQVEVARALGKTQSFVNKIETGERRADLVQVSDFCQAVGVDFVEFIERYHDALRQNQKEFDMRRVK